MRAGKLNNDPQRIYQWIVSITGATLGIFTIPVIPNIHNILTIPKVNIGANGSVTATPPKVALPPTEFNSAWCRDVSLPFFGHAEVPISRQGSRVNLADFSDCADLQISFYEQEGTPVINYLTAWRLTVQNRDGTYNYPAMYKRTVFAYLLDAQLKVQTTITLYGVFPSGHPAEFFSYVESGIKIVTQSFSVDSQQPGALGVPSVSSVLNSTLINNQGSGFQTL